MYLLYSFQQGLLGNIGEFFHRVLIWLFLFIDTFVYWLINISYQTFLAISQIRIFSDEDIYDLSQRIYILIGVFALFFVAYALLMAIVNPDNSKKDDKSLGKIVPNIAVAIIGIAIVPAVFNIMYDVQHAVLCGNVIPKLVLGNSYNDGFDIDNTNSNKLGSQMATLLFKSFFYVQDENGDPADLSQADTIASTIYENDCNGSGCLTLSQAYKSAENGSSFFSFRNFSDAVVDGKAGYLFIVSTLAGGFCVYVLVSLCLDMALRAVKLSYLQIIAPLPLLTIIIPGQKKVFANWIKKTISCFIEVFVRLFVVIFIAYIMRTLDQVLTNLRGTGVIYCGNISTIVWLLVKATTIVGLFWFIKIAPKLISDITGMDSKGFKLGIKDKLAESGAFQVVGGLGAGATAGVRNLTKIPQHLMNGASKGKSMPGKVIRGGLGALRGAGGVFAGAGSGFARGVKSNTGTKGYRDLVGNTSRAALDAEQARINRELYAKEHGDNIIGIAQGHIKDAATSTKDTLTSWISGKPSNNNTKAERLNKIETARKAIYDAVKDDKSVKVIDALYEGEIEKVKNSNLSLSAKRNEITRLQTAWGDEKDKAIASAIASRSNNIDMKRLLTNYSDIIANELPLITETLTETGNIGKSNYKDLLNDPSRLRMYIMSGAAFQFNGTDKGIGLIIGKDSAKYSASLRIKQAQKDSGKK